MSISSRLNKLLRSTKSEKPDAVPVSSDDRLILSDRIERIEQDRKLIETEGELDDERLQKAADKEIRSAAENSFKRLHVVQRGRCPQCGDSLRQHLFASICDSCGWNLFDAPRRGPVRVHLADGHSVVEGERCYVVKSGTVLVLSNDAVVARVPGTAVSWIEYAWTEHERELRHRQSLDRLTILCGWCNGIVDTEADGFHMVQAAFGASQERYCFCSDDCYEAFRKMYPSRVHRDCYERSCSECDLCVKRYEDETEGMRTLAKDLLTRTRKR